MNRVLLLLIALLLACFLVLGPAGVGLYLRGWVPAWVDTWAPEAESELQSGWFASALTAAWPDDTRLELTGRHLPPTRLAWLGMEGRLHWPHAPEPMELRGRLGLLGTLTITGDAARLVAPDESRVATDARDASFGFRQTPDGAARVGVAALEVDIADGLDNHLDLGRAAASLGWQPDRGEGGILELTTRAERNGEPGLHLTVEASGVDPEALTQLATALTAYRDPPADGMGRRMLDLNAAGAWQALVEGGLEISRASLELSPETRVNGTWLPANGPPEFGGEGLIEDFLDWAGPVIGLSRGVPPGEAEREARAWLTTLVDHGWMDVDGERFELQYPVRREDSPAD